MSQPSSNMKSSSDVTPRMTKDGKFICGADNKTFNTRDEYERHCSEAHMKSSETRGW